jgi:hypothetical protein
MARRLGSYVAATSYHGAWTAPAHRDDPRSLKRCNLRCKSPGAMSAQTSPSAGCVQRRSPAPAESPDALAALDPTITAAMRAHAASTASYQRIKDCGRLRWRSASPRGTPPAGHVTGFAPPRDRAPDECSDSLRSLLPATALATREPLARHKATSPSPLSAIVSSTVYRTTASATIRSLVRVVRIEGGWVLRVS